MTIISVPEFNYFVPHTIPEACNMLEEYKGHAMVLAGGTDLLVSMKQRVKVPENIISLHAVAGLNHMEKGDQGLKIGSLITIKDLAHSEIVRELFPVLAEASMNIASPNIRSLATLGGNICLDTRCCYYNKSEVFRKQIGKCLKFGGDLCHVSKNSRKCFAVSQADTVPSLIALGATVKIESAGGERTIPIEELYQDDGKDYLKLHPEEVVTRVTIPYPKPGSRGSFQKLRLRRAIDFALVSVSVVLTVKDGICEDTRIVLGSVGTYPIRLIGAEELLNGKKLTNGLIEEAAELAYKGAKPVANMVKIPSSYRKEMARELMVKAIQAVLSKA